MKYSNQNLYWYLTANVSKALNLQNKKKEESFDLREIQQIIKELTVGINVFEELPAISLRPRYDKGEHRFSIPTASISAGKKHSMTCQFYNMHIKPSPTD